MSKSWRPNNEGEGRGLIRCKEPVVVSAISGSRTQTIEAVLMLEAVGLLNGEKGRCLPLTAPKHWLYVTCCAHHSPRPPPTWEAQCARFPICRFLLACGAAPCVISRSKAAHVFPHLACELRRCVHRELELSRREKRSIICRERSWMQICNIMS